jgi:hypothetical protein
MSRSFRPKDVSNSLRGTEEVDKIQEDDDAVREAHFSLFTRPLDSTPGFRAQPLTHWAVVVEYPGEKVYTFEAGQQGKEADRVVATRTLDYPHKKETGKLIQLGSKCISPKQLLQIAQNVSINGKSYNILVRNCQAWCKEFCGCVSDEFLMDQFWDAKNLAWLSLATFGGFFLVSSFILGAFSSSKKKREETAK